MPMRELATWGDTLYTRARTNYQRRTRPKLGALLASHSYPAASREASFVFIGVERPWILQSFSLASVVAATQNALVTLKVPTLPLLFQDSRRQHLAELTGKDVELSEREQEQNHYLAVSVVALAVSGTATLVYSPLMLLSVTLLGYLYIPVLKNMYNAFQNKEQRWLRSFEAILLGGELLAGYYLASALASTLYFVAERALVKVEERSKQSLINIFGQQPRSAWLLVDGAECQVPLEQVQAGDIVVVSAGETVPVDGSIVQGMGSIDQHMLTGEAQPVEKGSGDQALAATILLAGKIHIQVERAGNETTAAQIGEILNKTAMFKEKVETHGIAMTERFIPITVALGLFSFPFVGTNRTLALLESSFGYNLRMSGPMSLLNLLQVAAHQGMLIKDGVALEQLPTIDTVVFDKTGTLTLEQPHVGTIHTFYDIGEDTILIWAAAAEYRQTHPIARAILQAAREQDLTLPPIDDAHYKVGYGLQVLLDGHTIRVGSTRFMEMEQVVLPDTIDQIQVTCHAQGSSLVLVALNQVLVGAIELCPTIRPEACEVIQQLKKRDLNLYIISGDHQQPTQHIADRVGIDHFFAEVLPQDKAALVERLQHEGRTVCFVGDGINDAIALQQADLSISLRGATTAATDTAQVIMMDGSLRHLVALLDLGREYQANMNNNLLLATVPSIICIGGVYMLKWGVVTAIMLYNVSLVGSLGNAMLPLLMREVNRKNNENSQPMMGFLKEPEKGMQ